MLTYCQHFTSINLRIRSIDINSLKSKEHSISRYSNKYNIYKSSYSYLLQFLISVRVFLKKYCKKEYSLHVINFVAVIIINLIYDIYSLKKKYPNKKHSVVRRFLVQRFLRCLKSEEFITLKLCWTGDPSLPLFHRKWRIDFRV